VLVVLQMETARQFLPFVRLDGYYVVSDLAGVPNLFAYIQPVLVTLLRRGDEDTQLTARRKLDELNPRARRLIKGWVYLTAPVLVVNGVVFLFLAPRLAGSVWASGAAQLRGMTTADGHFDLVRYLDGVVALVLLALPLVGMAYVFTRLARRMSTNVATWWQARPLATATASVALLTLVALQVAVEWPDTFAEAVQKAQVAQAIEDGHDGTGNTAEVALPMTPAAEAAQVGPSDPPPESEPPGTEAPTTSRRGSGESHGTESSTTRPTGSSGSTATARPSSAGGATTTTATKSSSAPSTTADDGLPTTGVQPGTQDVPRGNGNGNGGTPRPPQTTTTTTTRPPSTTTTTRPGSLIGEILDLIF